MSRPISAAHPLPSIILSQQFSPPFLREVDLRFAAVFDRAQFPQLRALLEGPGAPFFTPFRANACARCRRASRRLLRPALLESMSRNQAVSLLRSLQRATAPLSRRVTDDSSGRSLRCVSTKHPPKEAACRDHFPRLAPPKAGGTLATSTSRPSRPR